MEQRQKAKRRKGNSFYPRKLVGAGGTRTLAVGRILPHDWNMVKVSVEKLEGSECVLRLERIM